MEGCRRVSFLVQCAVNAESLRPIPLVFWRSANGREPVREWLNELSRGDKRTIGRDIAKVQYGWPVGLPLCRPLSGGLCQEDTEDPGGRSGAGKTAI